MSRMSNGLLRAALACAWVFAALDLARAIPPEPPAAVPGATPGAQARGAAAPAGSVPAAGKPSAAPASKPAALKRRAPDFVLRDIEGREVSLRKLRGKLVVLEWFNPDCPFVKHAHTSGPLRDMAKRRGSEQLVWLSINSSAPGKQGHGLERNRAAQAEYAIENPILLDENGEVGRRYGAEKTPHLFVIDRRGLLVYRGGLDNAPMGVVDDTRPRLPSGAAGALEPYLENALDDVLKGRAPRLADTPPYGCGVKYQAP
jgi:peroxiredoxin